MEWALAAVVGLVAAGGLGAIQTRTGVSTFRQSSPMSASIVAPLASLERPNRPGGTVPAGHDAHDIRWFDSAISHPGHGITPRGVIAAFTQAEQGDPTIQCDVIDDLIEGDCTLRNLFEQREQAVAGKPWVMQADGAEGDGEIGARVLGAALRQLAMIETFQHLLTFNRYGWACAEIDWGLVTVDGRVWIVPTHITCVPARRFRISPSNELRLYADVARPDGDALKQDKWIVLRRSGTRLARAGLMRTAAGPSIGKRFGFRDWMVYSQRFGLPLPIVNYPDEADDEDIAIAEEIVRKIGSDGGAVKPKSLELEFEDATRGNNENSKAHGGLISYCNAEMSKLINGSTLSNDSTGSGGASYALGEVHADRSWDNVQFDAERIQEAFRTQVGAAFMRFNNLSGSAPLLKIQVVRDLAPKTRAEIADVFVNKLGIPVSVSQLRQETGYREPLGDGDAAPGVAPAVAQGVAA